MYTFGVFVGEGGWWLKRWGVHSLAFLKVGCGLTPKHISWAHVWKRPHLSFFGFRPDFVVALWATSKGCGQLGIFRLNLRFWGWTRPSCHLALSCSAFWEVQEASALLAFQAIYNLHRANIGRRKSPHHNITAKCWYSFGFWCSNSNCWVPLNDCCTLSHTTVC